MADIRIAPGVDTTHPATLDAINCLRRFLPHKMDPESPKDYLSPTVALGHGGRQA